MKTRGPHPPLRARFDESDGSDEVRSTAYLRLTTERTTIIHRRDRGVINDNVMRRFLRDHDLEVLQLQEWLSPGYAISKSCACSRKRANRV